VLCVVLLLACDVPPLPGVTLVLGVAEVPPAEVPTLPPCGWYVLPPEASDSLASGVLEPQPNRQIQQTFKARDWAEVNRVLMVFQWAKRERGFWRRSERLPAECRSSMTFAWT
jgi:hypothetical protein